MLLSKQQASKVASSVKKLRNLQEQLDKLHDEFLDNEQDLSNDPRFVRWSGEYAKVYEKIRSSYESTWKPIVDHARSILDLDQEEEDDLYRAEQKLPKVELQTGPSWSDDEFEEAVSGDDLDEQIEMEGFEDTIDKIGSFTTELEQLAKPLKLSTTDRRILEGYASALEDRAKLVRQWIKR